MGIKTIAWNSYSLLHKKSELSHLILDNNIQLVLISESWLTSGTNVSFPNFNCYRVDRHRGGVCVFVHKSIPHTLFRQVSLEYAEAVFIKIHNADGDITVGSVYCSPAASRIQAQAFFVKILSTPGPSVLAGDFNAKHMAWNNVSFTHKGSDLLKLCNIKNFLIHPPDRPTLIPARGEPSVVDFVLSKSVPGMSNVKVLNELSSDHLPIQFSIPFNCPSLKNIKIFNYKKADWKMLRTELSTSAFKLKNDFPSLGSSQSIDKSIKQFVNDVHAATKKAIPKKLPFCFRYPFSRKLQTMTKSRNHYRNLFLSTGDPHFKSAKNQLNRLIKQETSILNQKSFEHKIGNLNAEDRSLYKLAKCLKHQKTSSPPLKNPDGTLAHSNEDKANAFANAFLSCHKTSQDMISDKESIVKKSIDKINRDKTKSPPGELIKLQQVKEIIKSLKIRKAPGSDKISNLIIQAFPDSLLSFIVRIFNSCLEISYFPTDWKCGKIIAIPKPGKVNTIATNFRPISLLSTVGKIFERLILDKFNKIEKSRNIFIQEQCGFRSEHSTIHQVLRITEKASLNFNRHKSTGLVLLDIEKAFDSVWHDALVHKLIKLEFPSFLVKIIQSYLKNRQAFVEFQGAISEIFDIPAGVPQGSLLAPFLFNIFINDVKTPNNTELAIYADDTALMCEASWKNANLIKGRLEAGFLKIEKFFSSWKIKINSSKTEFIVFTKSPAMKRKLEQTPPVINGSTLQWKNVAKYLGVNLDSGLNLRAHIDSTISKANAVISSLFCILKRHSSASAKTKILIYKAYIRPILTYAGTIIINCPKTNFQRLQVMENKCLRMALNLPYGSKNSLLHEQAKIPTIKEFVDKNSNKFYEKVEAHDNLLLNSLGSYVNNPLPFRLRHKLPRKCQD